MKLKLFVYTFLVSSLCSNMLLASGNNSTIDKYLSKIAIFETKMEENLKVLKTLK